MISGLYAVSSKGRGISNSGSSRKAGFQVTSSHAHIMRKHYLSIMTVKRRTEGTTGSGTYLIPAVGLCSGKMDSMSGES